MAAIGLASSIIAVIQITLAITESCYQYKTSLKNASKSINQILTQVNSLRSVLENLVEVIESETEAQNENGNGNGNWNENGNRDGNFAEKGGKGKGKGKLSRLKALEGLAGKNGLIEEMATGLGELRAKLGMGGVGVGGMKGRGWKGVGIMEKLVWPLREENVRRVVRECRWKFLRAIFPNLE